MENGTFPASFPKQPSYESLEIRNTVNTVLVNLEKLVHAVGALCAYALNVDDDPHNNAVGCAKHLQLGTFLGYFLCWTQGIHASIGIEGVQIQCGCQLKSSVFDLAYALYLDVTMESFGGGDDLPLSLVVTGLVERGVYRAVQLLSRGDFHRAEGDNEVLCQVSWYGATGKYWSSALLAFISWHLKSRGEQMHGIHIDVAPRSTDITCFPSWCADDANRKQFAKVMGADLSALLAKMLKKN